MRSRAAHALSFHACSEAEADGALGASWRPACPAPALRAQLPTAPGLPLPGAQAAAARAFLSAPQSPLAAFLRRPWHLGNAGPPCGSAPQVKPARGRYGWARAPSRGWGRAWFGVSGRKRGGGCGVRRDTPRHSSSRPSRWPGGPPPPPHPPTPRLFAGGPCQGRKSRGRFACASDAQRCGKFLTLLRGAKDAAVPACSHTTLWLVTSESFLPTQGAGRATATGRRGEVVGMVRGDPDPRVPACGSLLMPGRGLGCSRRCAGSLCSRFLPAARPALGCNK